ncbi:DUF5995 family protein [Acidicapsa acidisoli]|uniref:DUF5995 family protein n=1 Tax=Acidicapsa acidisoli TaxID=1615681 RepID=UPI0021DF79B9|nr:DUF5995 family protein [Acidicapsa acidisoli]
MFPYDAQILTILQTTPASIADVLATMQAIEALTINGDGLKWFNQLYFQVTQAVEARVAAGGFADAAFLSMLDVQFAQLYFDALKNYLSNNALPDCWQTLFAQRNQTALTRIQYALAGVNSHINHDLPCALVSTCALENIAPQHGTTQYNDYTALNSTLDSLIDEAKTELNVRFLGDALPGVSQLENTLAAWNVTAARESAWNNAEILWHLRLEAGLATAFLDTLDGLTSVVNKTLLIPIP